MDIDEIRRLKREREEKAKLNVLIVGSGAREHALAWSFGQSKLLGRLFVAPGNGGTSDNNVKINVDDIEGLCTFAQNNNCFTVVGPELPLSLGIVDHFKKRDLPIFGPTKRQALLETSKVYAKLFMEDNGIPTAEFAVFTKSGDAFRYAKSMDWQVVVKADGLAWGKGAIVCSTKQEVEKAATDILDKKIFGNAGYTIVVEKKLVGDELSVFALADGSSVRYIGTAVDHKQLYNGGKGPNTGGMGAYSPTPEFGYGALIHKIVSNIINPTVQKTGFMGFFYAGMMITEDGPKVLEYNVRLGDPEAQVILPRLNFDLLENVYSISKGKGVIHDGFTFNGRAACCVSICSEGYPADYRSNLGRKISISDEFLPQTLLFHAGTKRLDNGDLITNGGRVLSAVGLGPNLYLARLRAYQLTNSIQFEGGHHRTDIGIRIERSKVRTT